MLLIAALADLGAARAEAPVPPLRSWEGDVLLLGDSLMKAGVAPGIKRGLGRSGLAAEILAKPSTGLTREDFFDWPKAAREKLAARKYGAAVVLFGTNDCQSMKQGGKELRFGTEAWRDAYRTRVRGMLDILCEGGRKVVWIGLPPMRPAGFDRRIGELNGLVEKEVAARSACAEYLPLAGVVGDARGRYTDRRKIAGRNQRVRDGDGIHLSAVGAEAAAVAALDALDSL